MDFLRKVSTKTTGLVVGCLGILRICPLYVDMILRKGSFVMFLFVWLLMLS